MPLAHTTSHMALMQGSMDDFRCDNVIVRYMGDTWNGVYAQIWTIKCAPIKQLKLA